MTPLPDTYASPIHLPFNRASLEDRFKLGSPLEDPGGAAYCVLLQGHKLLVDTDSGQYQLPFIKEPGGSSLYLGTWQGRPCRLFEFPAGEVLGGDYEALSLVEECPVLPIDLLSLGGMSRMILHWQHRSRFCGYCGKRTEWQYGDWGRSCQSCQALSYPAIHPCAIILVRRPGEVLLTRKPNWAPDRYSLVAGFQEFGESLEEAALREVAEETGIVAENARYVGSQCWPFPSQVMVGFVADYVSGEIEVDTRELADARWFPLGALPKLPPKRSIARYILDTMLGLNARQGRS